MSTGEPLSITEILLMQQSMHRLGELQRLEGVIAELREILIDWYIAIDVQRYTGNPNIRNGVELRMLDIAKWLYADQQAIPDGERQP